MSKALVFGGSGQLGIAVAEQLLTSGWRVAVVTREGRIPPQTVTRLGAGLIDGTGKSRAEVLEIAGTVDAVFDPTAYGEDDAQDLLRARSRYGRLVVVSSCGLYRDRQGRSLADGPEFAGPIGEDTPIVEPGPASYASRKAALERALLESGVGVSILRPCAVYGLHATHPREWWFIKRALDGRRAIPVAYGARSVFHTSGARGVAGLTALCLGLGGQQVLNVADPDPLPVVQIAAAISTITGLPMPLAPFEGPPVGDSHVGSTPWSSAHPYVLDTSRARALGWDGGPDYRTGVEEVCRWVLDVGRRGDWRSQFTTFARYGYDPFDYDAEDGVLAES